MGLLDDAIREHLELKRQHGAGEDEVRRQEQEALGPPRRGEVPQPLAPPDDEQQVGAVEAAEQPVQEGEVAPGAGAATLDEDESPVQPADDVEPAATAEQDVWLADPAEPPPAAYAAPQAQDPELEDPSADYVLEETPEFLQETPEHDRLWFEQKPPKDFDFDK